MEVEQNNKLRMYTAVETVLDAHPDALDGLTAAQEAATDFRALLATFATPPVSRSSTPPAATPKTTSASPSPTPPPP